MGKKQSPSGTHAARAGGTLGDHRGSPETTRKAEAEPRPRPDFPDHGPLPAFQWPRDGPGCVHQGEAAGVPPAS